MEIKTLKAECVSCDCSDCLKACGIYNCPGCVNCIGPEEECENKVSMEDFLNELHLHLKKIYKHFTDTYGQDAQWWKLLEEAGELIEQIAKTKNDIYEPRVLEEAADYVIVAMQIIGDCARTDIGTTSTKQLYNNLTNPIMMYFRGVTSEKLLINKSLRYVVESIYQEVERHDLMEEFNMIIFSKVMRTIERIETNYYEDVLGGNGNERVQ